MIQHLYRYWSYLFKACFLPVGSFTSFLRQLSPPLWSWETGSRPSLVQMILHEDVSGCFSLNSWYLGRWGRLGHHYHRRCSGGQDNHRRRGGGCSISLSSFPQLCFSRIVFRPALVDWFITSSWLILIVLGWLHCLFWACPPFLSRREDIFDIQFKLGFDSFWDTPR